MRHVGLVVVICFYGAMFAARAAADSTVEHLTGPGAAARLRGNDANERRRAATLLGRYGARRPAVAALRRALDEERDPEARVAIVVALAKRGDPAAVPSLVQALMEGAPADRAIAGSVLGAFATDGALRGLTSALSEAEAQSAALAGLERAGAVSVPYLLRELRLTPIKEPIIDALGVIRDPRAIAPLVPLTRDRNEEVRAAAVGALARIGDDRAIHAVRASLGDDSERVRLAAIEAMARLGTTEDYAAVEVLAQRGSADERAEALRAMFVLDPRRGAQAVGAVLARRDPALLETATEIAVSSKHPAVVPLLHGLLRAGGMEEPAADALAAVDGGAGVPALLREARRPGEAGEASRYALAVALRTWGERVRRGDREAILALLRRGSDRDRSRSRIMRAIARDETLGPELVKALRSSDAGERECAADALGMLGDRDQGSAVAAALARERDPDVFRSMALTAVVLGAKGNVYELLRTGGDTAMAPETMWLAVHSLDGATPQARTRLRELLRRNLGSAVARVRAVAAISLGALRDRSAWRALVDRLDDPSSQSRRATARALEMLAVREAVPGLEARWRAEQDATVRSAIEDAIASPDRRPRLRVTDTGREVVRVRLDTASDQTDRAGGESEAPTRIKRGVPLDVVLPDGQWWWVRTLPSGEFVMVDLPFGEVDVHARK